ncbi:hypothetical protein AGLY_009932 [Aphis glycines]|uniref:Uncharacterized protein n=1 Tax=Aphis glycines TaxID=307491 RepID=A0A6G0TGK6_APHGL|nr:hypothetical protein AGLY_009932 [Aphis glycines]
MVIALGLYTNEKTIEGEIRSCATDHMISWIINNSHILSNTLQPKFIKRIPYLGFILIYLLAIMFIKKLYSRSQFSLFEEKFITFSDVPDEKIFVFERHPNSNHKIMIKSISNAHIKKSAPQIILCNSKCYPKNSNIVLKTLIKRMSFINLNIYIRLKFKVNLWLFHINRNLYLLLNTIIIKNYVRTV